MSSSVESIEIAGASSRDELLDDGAGLAEAVLGDRGARSASPCAASSSAVSSTSIHFGLPTCARSSSSASQMLAMISACASSNASRIVSSGTWSPPASTIVSASLVPTTIRSSVDSSSCWSVGLTTSSPSIRPMRTAPTGPRNGSGEIISAADAPLMQRMSCGVTRSAERTVQMTCTSLRKPFGQSGRIGRSIIRAVSVARSVARPSRLKKPPGIFPAAYIRSSTSTVSGKKSASGRASGRPTAVARIIVSPAADDDGAVGLLGELARLEDDLLTAHVDGHRGQLPGGDCAHRVVSLHSSVVAEGGGLSQLRSARAGLAQTSTSRPVFGAVAYRRRPSSLMRAR